LAHHCESAVALRGPLLFLASSNPGKIEEFRALAAAAQSAGTPLPGVPAVSSQDASTSPAIELLPGFDTLPAFEENEPTFAENGAGKALHYSRLADGLVFADDSGLVVPALGGEPGVRSARYAGPQASNAERIAKLLRALREKTGEERKAHFVCAIALAEKGRVLAVVTDRVDGEILEEPHGNGGFGYDPVFYFPALRKTFAELLPADKNQHSHRGKAFRKLLRAMGSSEPALRSW
jgi:XTP/dITP diphosphohydrolase